VPGLFAVPAALAVGFLAVPLVGLLGRTPWGSIGAELTSPRVLEALRLSLVCSLGAVAVSVALGVPLAFLLARVQFPGRNLVRALTTLPMVLPPVVGGVALLLAFGRRGLAGQWLDRAFGITLPFTTAGAVLAEAFVAMPFLVITVLCWARALGEFGATITFAGNLPGVTQTMPLAVYLALETDLEAAIALSLTLLVISLAVLIALRDRWFPSA
jgi:molybdate transport system permease protein